jgi:glycosyltransferase involved in cell wall biosynthesis
MRPNDATRVNRAARGRGMGATAARRVAGCYPPRMPAISVLMPVRDAAPWLRSSLASLWRQTWRDFEVVAVDDGSSDGSGEALEQAAAAEPRLRVIRTPPRGLPAALATSLASARGTLIARHDADDLSHRSRLALQRAFLAAHPRVSVVGCRVRLFPAPAVGAGMRRWADWHNGLVTHQAMARELLIDSPLAHGGAMIRRGALLRAGGWEEHGWPEDLDLWVRMLASGARFAKLPRVLYAWRQHPSSATRRDPRYHRGRFIALRRAALESGLLRRARRLTLVGVGRSLDEWRRALAGDGRELVVLPAGRPSRAVLASLAPPVVLVFGAAPSRRRWREALSATDLIELTDFVFVA